MKKIITIAFVTFSMCVFGQVPTNGLLGYYPFNGNANDESGNGYNGIITGATLTTDRFGNNDAAYSFNGLDNRIVLDNTSQIDSNKGISLMAWVVTNNPEGASVISKHKNYTGSGYNLAGTNNQAHFWSYVSNPVSSGDTYNDDKWHFYVGTFDGITAKIYVDGILKNSAEISLMETNSELIKIGSDNEMSFFNGKIDDVRIFSRAVNDQEVLALYTETLSVFDALTQKNEIIIFNTPSEGNFNFYIQEPKAKLEISIFNSLGQKVFEIINTDMKSDNKIEFEPKAKGMYLIKIYDGEKEYSEKMLVK